MKKLAIFGTGGFAKEILDLALDQGYTDICFLDATVTDEHGQLLGFPILAESEIASLIDADFVIGIASPKIRQKIYEAYPNLVYPTLVHSQASLGYGIRQCLNQTQGIIIAAGARITNSCQFGHFSLISFNSTIGHDCIIGKYVSIMPGANISGCIVLKDGTYVGTNACILPGSLHTPKILGEYSVIGAGAVVLNNTLPHTTYVGTPAKELKR